MQINFQKLRPEAILPEVAYVGDLGLDIRTCEAFTLPPGGSYVAPTGLQLQMPGLPEPLCTYLQLGCFVWSKSGLSVKSNIEKGAGVIDPNYTGELMIKLYNHGETVRSFAVGDKVAQLVFQVCAKITAVSEVNLSDHQSERGRRGFGSSGR